MKKIGLVACWVLVAIIIATPISLAIMSDYKVVETAIYGVEVTHVDYSTSKSSATPIETYIVSFWCDEFSGTAKITAEQYATLQKGDIIEVERAILENSFGDISYLYSYIGRLRLT